MRLLSQVVLVIAVVASVVGGVVLLVRGPAGGSRMEILLPTATAEARAEMKVYLSGAVRQPGVYAVQEGDRLAEAVEAAGGLTEEADAAAVNLAVRVKDEQQWHIPKVGEAEPIVEAQANPTVGGGKDGGEASGRIDLNSAPTEALKGLEGIGEVLAQRIVDYREANGPFASVEDLTEVRGIGSAILDKNRDLVEVR